MRTQITQMQRIFTDKISENPPAGRAGTPNLRDQCAIKILR
jgi:hypothetical protein